MPVPERSRHLIYSKMISIKIKREAKCSSVSWSTSGPLMEPTPLTYEEKEEEEEARGEKKKTREKKKLALPLRRGLWIICWGRWWALTDWLRRGSHRWRQRPIEFPAPVHTVPLRDHLEGRASSTCTYAEHTLMWDETDIFRLEKKRQAGRGEEGREMRGGGGQEESKRKKKRK